MEAKAEPTPPVPTTRILTARVFYRTRSRACRCKPDLFACRTPRRGATLPAFPGPGSEVDRERVGDAAQAVRRRRVGGVVERRDTRGRESGDGRGNRRGAE